MSSFVRIIKSDSDVVPALPEYIALQMKYEPDRFQKFAIHAIENGENVLVTAPTGSGKSFVAEYQIAKMLQKNKRVFLTTPIKSLSNQKFHDLRQMWSEPGAVGIMTGDIKFCPDAKIIIMTTEILRNLLYKKGTTTENLGLTASLSLENLGAVIFDECHYINDKDRGKVWEDTMILLPPEVQLVMLSATLERPELFAQWIGNLKQVPCHLIQTQHRVVPLTHYITRSNGKILNTIFDAKEVFYDSTYSDWLRGRTQAVKDHEEYQRKVAAARRQGVEGAIAGKTRPVSFQHQLNECIGMLEEQKLLPALAFVLSRKGCERLADHTSHTLLDTSDTAAATKIFDFHLRHHRASLEQIQQYHTLRSLIARGIAFHHSGVLPVLKEVIELLFSKGYIKLLYCTETFAVGINMPTKTVIFTGLKKYDDATGGMRFLRTDEYIQMAGRAGRRGKDPIGTVIYLPEHDPPTVSEMRQILKGGRPEIQSRMDFHYDFLLKCHQQKATRWLEIQDQSYWKQGQEAALRSCEVYLQQIQRELAALPLDSKQEQELLEKERLEQVVATTQNAKRKAAQRQLTAWEDDHRGSLWERAAANLKEKRLRQRDFKHYEEQKQHLQTNQGDVPLWLDVLKATGFLNEDGTLPLKGILATECNEAHGLLIAEAITRGYHKGLSGQELMAALACFMEEKETETTPSLNELSVPKPVKEFLCHIDEATHTFTTAEAKVGRHSPEEYWRLTTTWIEPVWRWMQGDSVAAICSELEVFEGNFVRAILRVANMLDELTAVATLVNDLELLAALAEVKPTLVRDIVVPDSLYLHL
jgi:superfamily II RNA helicase